MSALSSPAFAWQEPVDQPNGRPSLPQVCQKDVTASSVKSASVAAAAATASEGPAISSREMRAVACRIHPEPCPDALDDTVTEPPSATTWTTRGSPTTIG